MQRRGIDIPVHQFRQGHIFITGFTGYESRRSSPTRSKRFRKSRMSRREGLNMGQEEMW